MKVVETINNHQIVEMSEISEDYAPCLLDISIRGYLFDNNKYDVTILVKEDGWGKERYDVYGGKRAVNNKLSIFGLSI